MKLNKLTTILAVSASATFASNALAATYIEEEAGSGMNDSVMTAVNLGTDTEHTINGVLSASGGGDVDYYTFRANAGDVLNFDIDNGHDGGSGEPGSVDTVIGIYDHSGVNSDWNDNSDAIDEGSVSRADPYIAKYTVPATGSYTVGVGKGPGWFDLNGNYISTSPSLSGPSGPSGPGSVSGPDSTAQDGTYTLIISREAPPVKQINFEVKPGSRSLSPLRPSSQAKIPVAIFGSDEIDVSSIVLDSLTFGATGNEKSLDSCQKQTHDLNKDNHPDLVCHFKNDTANFKSGDYKGKMKGILKGNNPFEGSAQLKVYPTKRK